jgi:hypothetical protein
MQNTMRSLVISLTLVLCVPLLLTAQQETSPNPAPQTYQGRLKITVTGLENVRKWEPFPNSGVELTPREGENLIVVKFKIKNIQTGEEDTADQQVPLDIEELKDFELEDTQGKKYPSRIGKTNLRHAPFVIPKGTELKLFRMVGLTFDIQSLAKSLDKK